MTTHTRAAPARTTTTAALELATVTTDAVAPMHTEAAAVAPLHTVALPPTLKLCTGCRRSLPLSAYSPKGDRLQPKCKPCRADARRANYAANGDAEQAERRARRAEARAAREADKAAEREVAERAARLARWERRDATDEARELRYARVLEHGKKCPKCGEHQSAACFYEREESSDGFQSWCIGCLYAAASNRQRENADEINANRRERREYNLLKDIEDGRRPARPMRWW